MAAWPWLDGFCGGQYPNGEPFPQSPINIQTQDASPRTSEPMCTLSWENYFTGYDSIEFTGHSIELDLSPANSMLRQLNDEFCLASMHFHWARNNSVGSEHLIDGQRWPLEAHFVHFRCDYANVTDARCAGEAIFNAAASNPFPSPVDPYTLSVVSVLFEIAPQSNGAIDQVFAALSGSMPVADVDLRELVPPTLTFYAYGGSLTTPPCSPVVDWFVLQEKVPVSAAQMMQFRAVLDERLYRDTQPIVEPVTVSDCESDMEKVAVVEKPTTTPIYALPIDAIFLCYAVVFTTAVFYIGCLEVSRCREGKNTKIHMDF